MKRVLFVCVRNSARSQMAEAFLNKLAQGRFRAESAGLEPGSLDPLAVEVMKEAGIDISGNAVKSVAQLHARGDAYEYVITVCDESRAQRCPVFPGTGGRLHWEFEDPAGFRGSREERLERTRKVRDAIRRRIEEWIAHEK